jgi:hypothetical protein
MSDSPKLNPGAPVDPGAVIVRRVRMRKEDSAFVYAVFESHEGVLSYTTLGHEAGSLHRDLQLSIPATMARDAQRILQSLGDLLYELDRELDPEVAP